MARNIYTKSLVINYNLDKSFNVKWTINDDGKVEVEFIKEYALDELIGKYHADSDIDSVKLKHDFKNNKL